MNRIELKTMLEAEGIRQNLYSLDGSGGDECMVIEQQPSTWIAYYSERGQQTGKLYFATEDEACRYILETLVRCKSYQTKPSK
jgi:hypothetical protein